LNICREDDLCHPSCSHDLCRSRGLLVLVSGADDSFGMRAGKGVDHGDVPVGGHTQDERAVVIPTIECIFFGSPVAAAKL
jgi:hypothetical protein